MFTDPINFSGYEEINLDFFLYALNMEIGDRFHLEFSTGGAYSTIQTFTTGGPFNPEDRVGISLTLDARNLTANTRLRFRTETDANDDYVILDDIVITGCGVRQGPTCPVGSSCEDGDPCTTGETWDANCNCTGGRFTDNDGDGFCIGEDPDDNDICIPNASNCGPAALNCIERDFEDFEDNDPGIWNDGGDFATLLRTTNNFDNDGSYLFYLRGDLGLGSSLYSDPLNLSGQDAVQLEFNFLPYSMEDGDRWEISIATDGSNFIAHETFVAGVDFEDATRYQVTIILSDYQLTANTRLAFRSIAADSDYVMIDDIRLSACSIDDLQEEKEQLSSRSRSIEEIPAEAVLYPNPASEWVQLVLSGADKATLYIYDMQGRLAEELPLVEAENRIDLTSLRPSSYLFKIVGADGEVIQTEMMIVH